MIARLVLFLALLFETSFARDALETSGEVITGEIWGRANVCSSMQIPTSRYTSSTSAIGDAIVNCIESGGTPSGGKPFVECETIDNPDCAAGVSDECVASVGCMWES